MHSLHSFDLWQLAKEAQRERLLESERSRQIRRALADNIFEMEDSRRSARVRILPAEQSAPSPAASPRERAAALAGSQPQPRQR